MSNSYQNDISKTEEDYIEYLLRLLSEGGDFVGRIVGLRRKYKIPDSGFVANQSNQGASYPSDWFYFDDDVQKELLDVDIEGLASRYCFPPGQWKSTLKWYIFFSLITKYPDQQLGTVLVLEAHEAASYIDTHPVVLALGPNMTYNKLLNFINKRFTKEVKPRLYDFQNQKNLVGTLRKSDLSIAKKRNIIQSYSHLPRKEISKILREKHGIVEDVGNIGKIISLGKMEDQIDFEN